MLCVWVRWCCDLGSAFLVSTRVTRVYCSTREVTHRPDRQSRLNWASAGEPLLARYTSKGRSIIDDMDHAKSQAMAVQASISPFPARVDLNERCAYMFSQRSRPGIPSLESWSRCSFVHSGFFGSSARSFVSLPRPLQSSTSAPPYV